MNENPEEISIVQVMNCCGVGMSVTKHKQGRRRSWKEEIERRRKKNGKERKLDEEEWEKTEDCVLDAELA